MFLEMLSTRGSHVYFRASEFLWFHRVRTWSVVCSLQLHLCCGREIRSAGCSPWLAAGQDCRLLHLAWPKYHREAPNLSAPYSSSVSVTARENASLFNLTIEADFDLPNKALCVLPVIVMLQRHTNVITWFPWYLTGFSPGCVSKKAKQKKRKFCSLMQAQLLALWNV